jgi:hypothetical protein
MDSMPFFYADRVFTIVFLEDLSFSEVRTILDELLAEDAFSPHVLEQRGFYQIKLDGVSFSVWVSQTEVIIQRVVS